MTLFKRSNKNKSSTSVNSTPTETTTLIQVARSSEARMTPEQALHDVQDPLHKILAQDPYSIA
ncbi:hypothetical protein BGX20_011151 [Mortierella sp. AD010]|nr:hypothetical protein BGX20_011151 [Mortierella sp. AD010]